MEQLIPQHIFEQMLPQAAIWAQQQEQLVLANEQSLVLIPEGQALARRAGVERPGTVRILGVSDIPLPEQPDLRETAAAFELITPDTREFTIGHAIFILQRCLQNPKLIAHELKTRCSV